MQGAARVSLPRQRLRHLRHPAPLLNGSRVKPGMTGRKGTSARAPFSPRAGRR